jgi:hypothetical protein
MKLNLTKKATKATLFAAALLTTSFFARNANAQTPFQGTFTLQHSVYWGQTVLPAGNYRIRVINRSTSSPTLFAIQDANTGKMVTLESSAVANGASNKGNSELLIGVRGKERVVYSFRVAEMGESFIYDRKLANERGVEEASNTQAVPILAAGK